MKIRPLLFRTFLLLIGATRVWSQDVLITLNATDGFTPGQIQQGKPLGSYSLSQFESVNLGNGQLNLFIPIATVHGRGSVSVPLGVNVTGPIWNVEDDALDSTTCDVGGHGAQCAATWQYSVSATGWNGVGDYGGGTFLLRSAGDYCTTSTSGVTYWHSVLTRGAFVTPDGTETEFVDQRSGGLQASGTSGYNRGSIFTSDNGTFMMFTASADVTDPTTCQPATFGPTGTMVTKDGTTYTITGGVVTQIRDRNGNLTTFSSGTITDSLGRTYSYVPGSNIGYPGLSGAQRSISIVSGSLSDPGVLLTGESTQTYPELWPEVTNQFDTTTLFSANNVIKEIDLPDGTNYKFTYHAYGDVAQIILPTGARIQYDYTTNVVSARTGSLGRVKDSAGFSITIPSTPVYSLTRPLSERRVLDSNGNLVSKMDFPTPGEIDSYDGFTGNLLAKEIHVIASTSADPSSGTNYNSPQLGETTTITSYDTDGATVLQTQTFGYTQQNCLVACQTVQTATTTMNGGNARTTTYGFDGFNNVNDEQDFDWSSNGGGLLREIKTTYNSSASYTNIPMLNLVSEVQVFDGSSAKVQDTTYTYDEYTTNQYTPLHNCPYIDGRLHDNPNFAGAAARGNPTTVSSWLNTTGGWLNTYQAYDIAGNLITTRDANGHTTTFDYADSYSDGNNRNSCGFVTTATNANGQTVTTQYDYGTGRPTSLADINGNQTLFSYGTAAGVASVDKLVLTTYADGSHSYLNYPSILETDALHDQTTTTDQAIQAKTKLDSLGRVVETDTNGSFASEQIVTRQSYDGLNRVVTSYNPYDSWGYLIGQDPNQPGYGTDPATTFTYDGIGRVKTATTADNAITRTSYPGNQTTVLDPAQVTQTMTYDGLGRLITLVDAALTTSYAYDGNSNMKQATQGSQTRTFTYDSLNRLTSSVNPESGTVLYTYDNVGNVYQRTDNRQIVTTNTYDALNRLQQTTYTNPAGTPSTPTVTYTYDSGTNANGQLTSIATSGVSTTSYSSFDVMGRFHGSTQQTGNQSFPFTYSYNYSGALTGETYPSGRSLTIGYDAANRQNAVNGTMSGQNTTYINSAGYAPNGGLLSYFTNNNLLTLNQLYNMHQQVSYLAVARGNNYQGQNYFAQTMDWGSTNNNGVRLNGKNEFISNNAALPSTPTFSQTFSYDGVNRLLSASDTGGWSQTYSYDQYGNMWMPPTSNPLPSLSGAAPTTNIYNANNQNPNVSYDGAGNQTSLGSLTLSYDAENRQSQIANLGGGTGTFQYDGLGHRVVKSLPSQTTTYVYDAFGQLAAEYYSGAKPTPPCTTCFLTYDYLGNVRMVTDAQANIVARHDFAPFGQEIPSGTGGRGSIWGSTSDVDMKFTGQIRDQESSEDFFNARYFAFALGRFNSPDPGNAGAMLGSSQSWNGYGYVSGNPLVYADPSGRGGNYSGIADGYCPPSQQTCQMGGPPSEIDLGISRYEELISGLPDPEFPGNTSAGQTIWVTCTGESLDDYQCQMAQLNRWLARNGFQPPIQTAYFGNVQQLFNGHQQLWSNTAGVGNTLTLATAAAVAAPLALSAEAPTLLGNSVGRVLWSGPGRMAQATRYAAMTYGTTLGQTMVGRAISVLEGLNVPVGPLWSYASQWFAEGAVGPVVAFTTTAAQSSNFIQYELPALTATGATVVYH